MKFRPELLEEVREKVKQVFLTIVTAVFLAVAANLVAAYFAIMFPSYLAPMIFIAVLVMTASVLVMTRTLLLPYSTLRTNAHCDLLYNEEGPLEFPSDYSPQNYAKQLVKMCCKKNDTLWNRLMEAPRQLGRTLHKKHPFTDVVEFLLLLWMAHEASTPTITLELEEKVTPLTQFKIRPKGGNLFLDILQTIEGDDLVETALLSASLHLPKDIEVGFKSHDRLALADAGILTLKGKHFQMNIRYHNSGWTPSISSMDSRRFPWPRLGGIPFNPFFLDKYGIDKLMRTKRIAYFMELHATVGITALLRSYFSERIAKEMEWVDKVVGSFSEYFDIGRYIHNMERKEERMALEVLDDLRRSIEGLG